MYKFNNHKVKITLQKVVSILEKHDIRYCFLGSIVLASINGGLHRDLGDLDVIIDVSRKDTLYSELKQLGYMPASGMFTFARKYLSLESLDNPNLLGVGCFYGKWEDDGAFVMGGEHFNVTIEPHAIKPTKRSLYGINFLSIPDSAIATGIHASKTNPKRQKELALLKKKHIEPLPNTYLHISIYGIRCDWLYHVSMGALNLLGNIRVNMGKPFDPWR